jgi:hypothetical protein
MQRMSMDGAGNVDRWQNRHFVMSRRNRLRGKIGLFSIAVLLFVCKASYPQTTISNVPSTDIFDKSSLYLELDFITKPVPMRKEGYLTDGVRAVYGLDEKTEIGANFYYTHDSDGFLRELQIDAKRSLYKNDRKGTAVAIGFLASLPVRDTRGTKRYMLVYSDASKTLQQLHGMRITGGIYAVVGGGGDFGTKAGFVTGIEQPINRRWSIQADWFTGSNRLGYSAPGVNFNISSKQSIFAGYNFGNTGRGNNLFSAYYSYTF